MAKTLETCLYNTLKGYHNIETIKELIEQDVDCNLSHFDSQTYSFIFPIQLAAKTNRHNSLPILYKYRNSPTKLELEKHITFYINHHDRSQKEENEILFDYTISRLLYTRITQHPKKIFDTLIAALHDYDNAEYRGQSLSEGSRLEIYLQLRIYTLFRIIIDMKINSDDNIFTIIENEFLHNLETYYFLISILHIPIVITKRIINQKFSDMILSQPLLIKYYKSIAKNLINKIKQLDINQEYTIPTGWIGHAICISFRCINQTYILIRIDNPSPFNPPNVHEIDQFNRIIPKILGQLHIDKLEKNINYFILLIDSIKRDLTFEEGYSLIYNCNKQIHDLEEIQYDNTFSFIEQANANCVVKCFEPGIQIRFGKKYHKIYQDILLNEKNIANFLAKRSEEENQRYLNDIYSQFIILAKEDDMISLPYTEKTRLQDKLKSSYKQHYKHILSNTNLEINHLSNQEYIPLKFENNNRLIELKNFFIINNHILLLGEAGCGKTTICQYITYSWTIGKLWRNQFQWLFYIKMRNLNTEFYPKQLNNYSLIDIIERECFQGYKLHDLDKQKLTNIFENPLNILWILDGCDERRIPKYLITIERELFTKSYLLLTSRPYVSHNFLYDIQIQIQNFTYEDIKKYINNYFSLTLRNTGNECWIFIQNSEQLLQIARIPACLEIICNLWENGKIIFEIGITMGQLYNKMCEYLLRRYLLKFHYLCNSSLAGKNIYQESKSLAFSHLEYIAFHATKLNRFTINGNEIIKIAHSLFLSVLQIGLLIPGTQNSSSSSLRGDNIYYFIHRSFQEYLCARYMIRILELLDSNDQKREVVKFITHQKYTREIRNIFSLFFELERSNFCTNQFWSAVDSEPRDLIGLRYCTRIAQWFPHGSCIFSFEDEQQINKKTIDIVLTWILNKDRLVHDYANTYLFAWFSSTIDDNYWLKAWKEDLFINDSSKRRYFLPDIWSIENIDSFKKIYDDITKNVQALHRLITIGSNTISFKRLHIDSDIFDLYTIDDQIETSEFIKTALEQAQRHEKITSLIEFRLLLQNYESFANLNRHLATLDKETWRLEIDQSVLENIDRETLDLLFRLLQQNILFFRYFKLPIVAFIKLYSNDNNLNDDTLCSLIVLITMSSDCLLTAPPSQNKLIRIYENETFIDIELDQRRWFILINAFDHARHIYGYSPFFEQND